MKKFKVVNYIHFDSIDSTNTWTKQNAHLLKTAEVTCITALEQTAGRGRWQRTWVSPKGENIYATLFFCLPENCPYIANLGQVLSLSCATVLLSKGFSPQIKWPNDLLLGTAKLGGILLERNGDRVELGIALGIGINVDISQDILDSIDQPAISLNQLSGHTWKLEQILNPLVSQFLEDLELLLEKGFVPFQKAFEDFLAYKGKKITCTDGTTETCGICSSVDKEGKLHLKLPSGEMLALNSGEIKF